jgi:hypothetical protein
MLMFDAPLLLAAVILQTVPAPPAAPHISQCGAPTGANSHPPLADCCVHRAGWSVRTSGTPDRSPSAHHAAQDERTRDDVATR